MKQLPIPEGVAETTDPDEIIRLWIGDSEAFVSLNNMFGSSYEVWGFMLADIASQVANMAYLENNADRENVFRSIEKGYSTRMEQGLNAVGRILNKRH